MGHSQNPSLNTDNVAASGDRPTVQHVAYPQTPVVRSESLPPSGEVHPSDRGRAWGAAALAWVAPLWVAGLLLVGCGAAQGEDQASPGCGQLREPICDGSGRRLLCEGGARKVERCAEGSACTAGLCCATFEHAEAAVGGGVCRYFCAEGFVNAGTDRAPRCVAPCAADVCDGDLRRVCDPQTGLLHPARACEDLGSCVEGRCCPGALKATPKLEGGRCVYSCADGYRNAGTPERPRCEEHCAADICEGSLRRRCELSTGRLAPAAACPGDATCTQGRCCPVRPHMVSSVSDGACSYRCAEGYVNSGTAEAPVCHPQKRRICAGVQIRSYDPATATYGAPASCPDGKRCVPVPGGLDDVCEGPDAYIFKTRWEVYASKPQVRLGVAGPKGPLDVDCDGDGVFEKTAQTDVACDYAGAKQVTIAVRGQLGSVRLCKSPVVGKFKGVIAWGANPWASMREMFSGCGKISLPAQEAPNLTQVSDMSSMFVGVDCEQNLNHWDTSQVTNMSGMFSGGDFDGEIGGWDTSKVTDMSSMFSSSRKFNRDISGWDTSKVVNMEWMFSYSEWFNRDIGGWDVSQVTNMRSMFFSARYFNRDLSRWKVGKVEDMSEMFACMWGPTPGCGFNQPLAAWDVTHVKNMARMFNGASQFNQPIGGWDVSHVMDMHEMFQRASHFNQPIGGWDVSHVRNMSRMFSGATRFNQPLGDWDVSRVTEPDSMFSGATAFRQDLSAWKLPSYFPGPTHPGGYPQPRECRVDPYSPGEPFKSLLGLDHWGEAEKTFYPSCS